ncbi:MAG: hypothetical protein ABI162_02365 [Luteolibacter sp.]
MLTNLPVSRALAQGKLVISVDETRTPGDPFKLPAVLRKLIEADIVALETGNPDSQKPLGDHIEASAPVCDAFEKLEAILRMAYNGIGAIVGANIVPGGITEADRLGVFISYGWEKGQLGHFTEDRLLVLGKLALGGETSVSPPAWRYSATLVSIIRAQLDTIESEQRVGRSGHRQISTADRIERRNLLEIHLHRARHHYCSASDDLDTTKELAKISYPPRRKAKFTANSIPAIGPPFVTANIYFA